MSWGTESVIGSAEDWKSTWFHTQHSFPGVHAALRARMNSRLKVELRRINRVKYSDDSNPLVLHLCRRRERWQLLNGWSSPPKTHQRGNPGRDGRDAPHRTAATGPSVCRVSICQLIIFCNLEGWPEGTAFSAGVTPNTAQLPSSVATHEWQEHMWRSVCAHTNPQHHSDHF